jgi:hypothetical protein
MATMNTAEYTSRKVAASIDRLALTGLKTR